MENSNLLGALIPIDRATCSTDDRCCGTTSDDIARSELDTDGTEVQRKYMVLAKNAAERSVGSSWLSTFGKFYSDEQRSLLPEEAVAASAGCGNPVGIAEAKPGEMVIDLGSGGGIDCFLVANEVGIDGYVIGIDMIPDMIELAQKNAEKLRTSNVVFKLGSIESISQPDNTVDLVISNCVIALSNRKRRIFSEILRVLKPHGRMVISDVVSDKPLPAEIRPSPADWLACVGGAAVMSQYIQLIAETGFTGIEVLKKEPSRPRTTGWQSSLINLTLRAYKPTC